MSHENIWHDEDDLQKAIDEIYELKFHPAMAQMHLTSRTQVIAALDTLHYLSSEITRAITDQKEADDAAERAENEAEDRHIAEESRSDLFI